jgi:mRNA-degrading endonuclease RelE of RelBE toxin-antitoxin system
MSHRKFNVAMMGLALLTGTFVSPALATKPTFTNQGENTTVVNSKQNIISTNNPKGITWKLDNNKAKVEKLTPVEQGRLEQFQNAIANQGMSAKDASATIGNANFKALKNRAGVYQIRLSQSNRVFFSIDRNIHTVKILQVGGHI